jgi:hypothetical protein
MNERACTKCNVVKPIEEFAGRIDFGENVTQSVKNVQRLDLLIGTTKIRTVKRKMSGGIIKTIESKQGSMFLIISQSIPVLTAVRQIPVSLSSTTRATKKLR